MGFVGGKPLLGVLGQNKRGGSVWMLRLLAERGLQRKSKNLPTKRGSHKKKQPAGLKSGVWNKFVFARSRREHAL